MDQETRQYEIAYLVSANIPEEDVFGRAGKITGFIQDAKGLISHIEEPKKRRLAYPIKKFNEAYFGWTRFSMLGENLAEFEKKLKQEAAIIRYLVVTFEEVPPERVPRQLKTYTPRPPTTAPEERMNIEELDKRLEEILGK